MNKITFTLLMTYFLLSCSGTKEETASMMLHGETENFKAGYVSLVDISNPENNTEVVAKSELMDYQFEIRLDSIQEGRPLSMFIADTISRKSVSFGVITSYGKVEVKEKGGQYFLSGNSIQDTFQRINSQFHYLVNSYLGSIETNPDSAKIYANQLYLDVAEFLERHRDDIFSEWAYALAGNLLLIGLDDSYFTYFTRYCTTEYLPKQDFWKYFLCQQLERVKNKSEGKYPNPGFTLLDDGGKEVSLSDFNGQVVLFDFWASWCQPCIKGFTKLKELHQKYSHKGLAIVGISVHPKEDDWHRILDKHQLPWTQLMDYNEIEKKFAVKMEVGPIPRYILLNRDHQIVYYYLEGEKLEEAILEYL